jgi:hypothetical protein
MKMTVAKPRRELWETVQHFNQHHFYDLEVESYEKKMGEMKRDLRKTSRFMH